MGTVFLQVQQEGRSNNGVKLFLGCLGLAALGVARLVLGTGTHPSRGPSLQILKKGTQLPRICCTVVGLGSRTSGSVHRQQLRCSSSWQDAGLLESS